MRPTPTRICICLRRIALLALLCLPAATAVNAQMLFF